MSSRPAAADLPDEVLHTIFSLLPAKSIARAGAVCKRWNRLYNTLQICPSELVFGDEYFSRPMPELVGSVDLSLRLLGGNNLKAFKLIFHPRFIITPYLDYWMRRVVHKQVEELHLDFRDKRAPYSITPIFKLPSCFFTCNMITRLVLGGWDLMIPETDFPGFGMLTELCLFDVKVTDEMLERMVATCPLLESLHLKSSYKLRIVKICGARLKSFSYTEITFSELCVVAPNLRVFRFSGTCYRYEFSNMPSLIDAVLCVKCLWSNEHDLIMFDKIANVEVLTLTPLAHHPSEEEAEPDFLSVAFHNLRELQLLVEPDYDDYVLGICSLFQLCTFPVLETLFIDLDAFNSSLDMLERTIVSHPPNTLLHNLRMVKISSFRGYPNEILLAKFLLLMAVDLELLHLVAPDETIHKTSTVSFNLNSALEELLLSPRASSEAQILLFEYGKDDKEFVPRHTRDLCES